MQKAIRNKFDQRKFKDILIATGDKVLVYAPLKLTDDARRLNIKDLLNQLILLQNQMLIEKKLPIFLKKSDPLSYQKMLSFLITMLLKLLLNMMNLWKCLW